MLAGIAGGASTSSWLSIASSSYATLSTLFDLVCTEGLLVLAFGSVAIFTGIDLATILGAGLAGEATVWLGGAGSAPVLGVAHGERARASRMGIGEGGAWSSMKGSFPGAAAAEQQPGLAGAAQPIEPPQKQPVPRRQHGSGSNASTTRPTLCNAQWRIGKQGFGQQVLQLPPPQYPSQAGAAWPPEPQELQSPARQAEVSSAASPKAARVVRIIDVPP